MADFQYRYIMGAMAKIMISLPDELVGRLDEYARRRGRSRSGLLRELAERELRAGSDGRRRDVERLLARAGSHGGANAGHVREQRSAR